jgi:hypothetical protein
VAITTLVTARTELQARGYNRFTAGRLDAWLNEAKNRFEDYNFDWPWLKTSTTGTAPVTISDLRRVSSVVDQSTKLPIDPVPASATIEFDYADLTLAGPPGGWYLTSDTVLTTFPVGTGTLSVRYIKFSPELSGDSDAPLIPARYRTTWVDLAEVEVLRYGVKDAATAGALEQGVFRRLGEIAAVYAMQAQTEYMETLVTGASTDG